MNELIPTSLSKGSQIVKTIYFYVVAFASLLMIIFPAAHLIDLGVRHFVFRIGTYEYYSPRPVMAPDGKSVSLDAKEEERRFREQQYNQIKRDIARDVSFLVVGAPLFIFNWRLIKRNKFSD